MYWLAGWCTYGLLRHLERVHPSLEPQRSVLYLMSVVKNIKPSDLVIPNKSDDVDENVEKKESLLMDHIQFSLKPERLNIRLESPGLFQPQS